MMNAALGRMASLRINDAASSERLRPSSALPSSRPSLFAPGPKHNGVFDNGDASTMSGLQRAVLYVLGEKTQMKVTSRIMSL